MIIRRAALWILAGITITGSGLAWRSPGTQAGSLFLRADDGRICLDAARQAATKVGVPLDLLLGVGLTETGRTLDDGRAAIWPWSVATQDGGVFYDSRREAQRAVESHLGQGRTVVDIGCMQINYHWHRDAFPSVAAMLDPTQNAHYAARHLRDLYDAHGDWTTAAAHYHSGDPARGQAYAAKVDANRTFAATAFNRPASGARARVDLFATTDRKPLIGGVALNKRPEPILPGFKAGPSAG